MTGAMKNNSGTLKACVAAYWRYSRQCPLVAFEAGSRLKWESAEQADILAVNKERYLIETEVKVSLSDFRKDRKKTCHRHFNHDTGIYPTAYFYFAVPKDLANRVSYLCANLYPYAGVLGCPEGMNEWEVEVYRSPKRLSGKRLSLKQLVYMCRAQSATLCRLAKKVEEQNRIIQAWQSHESDRSEVKC
jgi:hypothetical protein